MPEQPVLGQRVPSVMDKERVVPSPALQEKRAMINQQEGARHHTAFDKRIADIMRGEEKASLPEAPIDDNEVLTTEPFEFAEPGELTNWRSIEKVDLSRVVGGELGPLVENIRELAFSNFNDPRMVAPCPEVAKAMQVMQFGLQYLLFT